MKIVIITGGSRGIGAATALECARDGMGVILTWNANRGKAEEVVARIASEGGAAVALPLDVGVSASFPAFRAQVAEALAATWSRDRFDALVNNAGHGVFTPLETVGEDAFDGLYRVHLKGPFFLAQALLPLMADGGHIVNMVSATSRVATAGVAPYASFKAGLEVLTRYQAKELGPRGIRANSIAPGPIRTELGGGLSADFETLLAGQTALGRVGEAAEVGGVVAGLLSDRSRWINAQSIEVGGGYMI
ncbi:SDR family NAD(P)-dependent oxidoreductase [Albimonas pacifica]|uniref:NAD(P)-dependent dehydrogenase, short-chain alcohol dehydrogenase family n=1 Tax=Albimonas pacifica TaxID=1114924 RepID=A0A1I3BL93_9RHOB|nr:SDR family oxidoreductase [Albimonas pacifica]SFH63038.1 NAD(P)-dependent dehydrogenase, short-chain alcohol dehydrogenase family [Albimonas pacifica]